MKMKYLVFATVFAMLSVGCSEKKDTQSDLNKQSEKKRAVLEDSSNVIDLRLEGPKSRPTHGKLCLEGCRGLPCDEKVRCVMHNCPNIKAECNDSEHKFFKAKEKADLLMKCIQSQNIDALKDSVRYRAVLDSCENAYAVLKKGVPLVKHKYGVMKDSVLE